MWANIVIFGANIEVCLTNIEVFFEKCNGIWRQIMWDLSKEKKYKAYPNLFNTLLDWKELENWRSEI